MCYFIMPNVLESDLSEPAATSDDLAAIAEMGNLEVTEELSSDASAED